MIRATKETEAGRRFLDLQRKAKQTGRPTDELIQLYALEGFLDRLSRSAHADRFVLIRRSPACRAGRAATDA